MSPLAIDSLNFLLTFIPWLPAVLVWLWLTARVFAVIGDHFPGEDNRNRREAVGMLAAIGTLLVFFGIWWAGLSALEAFRCAFA